MTSDKVQSLLEISKPDIKKQMQQYIPGTKFTFSQSLQAAVFLNIPINEKGEVVYILGKIPG